MSLATERTVQLFEVLAKSSEPLTIPQLMATTGIGRASLSRLLADLVDDRMLVAVGDPPRYRLSTRIWSYGAAAIDQSRIRNIAFPHIVETVLALKTRINLAIVEGDEIIYVEGLDYFDARVNSVFYILRMPILATASGRAPAAFFPQREIDRLIAQGLHRYTERTPDNEALAAQIADIRRCRFALIDREFDDDISGLAVPIFDESGAPVGALGFPGTGALDLNFVERITPDALALGERISAALGYRGGSPRPV